MSELTQKYDKNRVTQIVKEGERELVSADAVIDSWRNAFVFNSNKTKGLRLPQIGALFAIKAHWTVSQDPAAVVMPTGTGKTEMFEGNRVAVWADHKTLRHLSRA